jgi:hypothetical protein
MLVGLIWAFWKNQFCMWELNMCVCGEYVSGQGFEVA